MKVLAVSLLAWLAAHASAQVVQPARREAAHADRIIVNVHHDLDDPKHPKCPTFVAGEVCRNDAHWLVSISGRRYDLTKDGLAKLAQALTELGKADLDDPNAISARTLIIRADVTASYGYVQKVMEQAAVGRLYKVEVGAGVPKGTI